MHKWIVEHAVPTAAALAVGIGVAVVVQLTRPGPPTVEVRPREPQPTATVVVYVHVDGAVRAPGVMALPAGARVFEAIDAAGGASDEAELKDLNLAARAADGQKLVIPARPPSAAPESDGSTTAAAAPVATTVPPSSPARINLNTASQRVLETLPGIGPVTAARIIDYR